MLPLAVTIVWTTSGLVYSFWWAPVVRHQPYWITPPDLWYSLRGARYIQHGALSYIYSSHSALVTLPGLELLMAPVSALITALGLVASVPGLYLPKPSAWYVLDPFQLVVASVAFFGLDALMRQLTVHRARRLAALVIAAAAMWTTVVDYGHPEDVLAVGLAAFAATRLLRGRQVSAAWLLGGAIATQLLVVLLVPIFVGAMGVRRGAAVLGRAAILPGFLAIAVLVPDFHDATVAIFRQPNFPSLDRSTPWVQVAPRIGTDAVAAGPGRMIAIAIAVAVGVWVLRRRPPVATLLLAAGCVLAARCIFEPVMVPYYVMPAAVVAVLGAALTRRWSTLTLAACLAIGLTFMTESHGGMWTWWAEMSALLLGLLLLPSLVSWLISRYGREGRADLSQRGVERVPSSEQRPVLDHAAAL